MKNNIVICNECGGKVFIENARFCVPPVAKERWSSIADNDREDKPDPEPVWICNDCLE